MSLGLLSKASFSLSGEEAQVLVCNSISVCVLGRQQGRGDVVNMNGGLRAPLWGRSPFSVIR